VQVLTANLNNPYVDQIHFLQSERDNEEEKPVWWSHELLRPLLEQQSNMFPTEAFYDKVKIVNTGNEGRLLASDAFRYASQNVRQDIAILVNLDIYFDESLGLLHGVDADLGLFTAYFLSRYEVPQNEATSLIGTQCGDKFQGSHDAVVFISPLPEALVERCQFALGSWGIESRLLWEFEQFGMIGRNPCFDIRSWHVHFNGTKGTWMPEVNEDGMSSIAFPDHLISSRKPDYPWDITRWEAQRLS
jgi:hypothetical protein